MKNIIFLLLVTMSFTTSSCGRISSSNNNVGQIANAVDPDIDDSKLSKIRLYKEMTEDEKNKFVSDEAKKILAKISDGKYSYISPQGILAIRTAVDAYASRAVAEKFDSCEAGALFRSDLSSVLNRGAKIAPVINAAFTESKYNPLTGIYVAMTESEFCPCLKSSVGPTGIFQLNKKIALENKLKVAENVAPTVETDDRCDVKIASKAAANWLGHLQIMFGANGDNYDATYAIAAYNAGYENLNKDWEKLKAMTKASTISYWELMANKDQLSPQFQNENIRYVPKFFAAAIVGENPRVFGVDLDALSSAVPS